MIKNILDNYFTNNLIKEIKRDITLSFNVDLKIEYNKNKIKLFNNNAYTEIIILAKPRHYKNYTKIISFCKEDAFNHLNNLKRAEKSYIRDFIKKLDKEDGWVK